MTDTCYNVDGPWTHCAKWKKPGQSNHMFYGAVYIRCTE